MTTQIKPSTSQERKSLFLETFINNTNKVSKVSPNSIVDALGSGVAKVSGKAEKDINLAISKLFPDLASGDELDQIAANNGIALRFGALGSSTYVRLVGTPGTVYNSETTTISSVGGIQFELEQNITIGVAGYIYAKIRSLTQGLKTNVSPLSINRILPEPIGHQYIVNETYAMGGRDIEDDETFRIRIKNGPNLLAKGTLAALEQKFILINNKVLKLFYQGITGAGKVRIAVATQTGEALTQIELDDLLSQSNEFFSLTDYRPFGQAFFYGVELINISYLPIDISFRVELNSSYNSDDIRKKIQLSISKYFDFRFFDPLKQRVEWDDLLQIVKSTEGVVYCADQYFYPRADIGVNINILPRLRGFLMLDIQGNIILDFQGNLQPVFYPNAVDFNFQQTVLNSVI